MVSKNIDGASIRGAISDFRVRIQEFEKASGSIALWKSDQHYRDLWDNLIISVKFLENVVSKNADGELTKKYASVVLSELERLVDYSHNSGESGADEILAGMQRDAVPIGKLTW